MNTTFNLTSKNTRTFSSSPLLLSDSVSDPGNRKVRETNIPHNIQNTQEESGSGDTRVIEANIIQGNQDTQEESLNRTVSEDSSVSDESTDDEVSDSEDEDVEESAADLAIRFNEDLSGFVEHYDTKMANTAQRSKEYITTFYNDRCNDRGDIESSKLQEYDKETKEEINSQRDLCSRNLNTLATTRDDTIDSMQSHTIEYDSDYGSDTERLDEEFNNIDPSFNDLTQSYNRDIDNIVSSLDEVSTKTQSVEESSRNNNETDSLSVEQESTKRKTEETEDITDTKKVKMEDSSNKGVASDKDTRSPLDYVLDKQQEDGYNPFDDIE